MESAGAAGFHMEDQVAEKRCGHRPGKAIVEAEEMVCSSIRLSVCLSILAVVVSSFGWFVCAISSLVCGMGLCLCSGGVPRWIGS